MRKLFILLLVLIVGAGAGVFWWFSPEQVAKRQVRGLFQQFSETVNTNDRAAVGSFLQQYLADDAVIQLDVSMSVLGVAAGDNMLSKQPFSKETFIPFIDNTLFALDSYTFNIALDTLVLASDGGAADMKAHARSDAAGLNHLMGKRIATKWVLKSDCDGAATLGNAPKLKTMHCVVRLNQATDLQDKNLHEIVEEHQKSLINK